MPARILVVDDDPLSAELICEILRSAGLDASFLTSSAEAAARLKREKYHAVFLDMRMPAPDGAELARQVRASRVICHGLRLLSPQPRTPPTPHCLGYSATGNNNSFPSGSTILITS